MSRVAWQFSGYSWAINPEEDSGWKYENAKAENLPIGATESVIQYNGWKSGRRQVSGWLWGPNAVTQYNNMRNWHRNRVISTLVDHNGESQKCIMENFEATLVMSQSEWKQGRQTWRFNAEFVTRP